LKATRNLESKSEEGVDSTNVCFMVNENTPKVTSESSLDECELYMDKLVKLLKNFPTIMIFLKRSENEKEK